MKEQQSEDVVASVSDEKMDAKDMKQSASDIPSLDASKITTGTLTLNTTGIASATTKAARAAELKQGAIIK
jgi:hypothetical protein